MEGPNIRKHNSHMAILAFLLLLLCFLIDTGLEELDTRMFFTDIDVIRLLIAVSIFGSFGTAFFALTTHHLLEQVQKQKQHLYEVRRQSDLDTVSGLKNRNALTRLAQQISEQKKLVSVLVCDIDGLKIINDTLGHAAGDIAIQQVAQILTQVCPINSQVFRTGGDEFLILIQGILLQTDLEKLYYLIKKQMASYNCQQVNVPLSMSIGFAVSSDELSSFWQVAKQADFNMYQEKRSCQEKVYQSIHAALLGKIRYFM